MVDTELEAKIRNVVEDVYQCKTTFKIKAKIVDDTYIAFLYLTNQDVGAVLFIKEATTEEEFLEFLRDDLQKRNLLRSKHFKIQVTHDIEV